MLIDLLNSSNYIMVNKDAIKILGLNTAVYCSELLNIYKKACIKKKLLDEDAFKVDRNYVTKQTSLSLEDQIKCDLNLTKVNIIQISKEDPDVIKFNIETFASIISSEDVKLLKTVVTTMQKNPKGVKSNNRDRIIINLKEHIVINNYDLLVALRDWIDSVMSDPKKYLSVQQVDLFVDKLKSYAKDNFKLALEIVKLATIHQYVDCQWAINSYEKDKQVQLTLSTNNTTSVRKTTQKITSDVGEEVF